MLPIINQVIKLYSNRGFTIHELVRDNEFECISNNIPPIQVNIATRDTHVPDAERSAKVMKERIRCILNALPYPHVPKFMITAAAEIANTMLNDVPAFDGVSSTISPATIITGRPPTNLAHLHLNFGDYVHLTVETLPYNSMKPRITPCIALRPTLNSQYSYYFMDLHTGCRRHGCTWQHLPITADVITTVDKLTRDQHQPHMNDGPIFEWGPDMPMDDDVVDDEYSSDDNDVSMSSVPIMPLILPQPVPPLNVNDASTNSAGSTTDDNVIIDDNDSNTLAPADTTAPLENAPAELPLDFVAPDDDASLENAPAELPLDFVAPDDASDVFVAKVVAPNDTDDGFIDDVDDAPFDVSIDAPAPVAVDVIADEAAVEVTIDHKH